jgi:predicted metal-dependent hydrolase
MYFPVFLCNGKTLNIGIIKSRRARQLWMKANVHGINVVVPINCETRDVVSFINSKKNWILKTTEYYGKFIDDYGQTYAKDSIYFLGTKYKLQIIKDKISSIMISEGLKIVTLHVLDKRKYSEDIKKWYTNKTAKIVSERLTMINCRLNLQYNKVVIRNQRSRWGSCSKKRNLNFNLFLAAFPPEVIDYVIIHELLHLKELNHSKKFWELVNAIDPHYKNHRELLHRYGALIAR